MAKLSRTEKNKQLREQLDQETTAAAAAESSRPIKLTRSDRSAQAALHATEAVKFPEVEPAQAKTSAVMDELIGEVKQYNMDNGQRVFEDTQINILRSLDETSSPAYRRSLHLEAMEKNEEAGGTTMNINAMPIEEVSRPVTRMMEIKADPQPAASRPQPAAADKAAEAPKEAPAAQPADRLVLGKQDLFADETIDNDNLSLFALGSDDFDKTIQQEPETGRKKSRKEARAARKARVQEEPIPEPAIVLEEDELTIDTESFPSPMAPVQEPEQPKEKSSNLTNYLLIGLIILLVILICYTIYLITKAGIL